MKKSLLAIAAVAALSSTWSLPAFSSDPAKPKSEAAAVKSADKETRARLESALKTALHIKKLIAKDPMVCQPWAKSEMPALIDEIDRIKALGRVDKNLIERAHSDFNVMYDECKKSQMKWANKNADYGIAKLQALLGK
jgi:hypothetical protein